MPEIFKNITRNILTRYAGGVGFGDVLYAPKGQFGPLVQRDYQLVLVLEGHLDLHIEKHSINIPPGHVVLCLPGRSTFFSFAEERTTRHQWCSAEPHLVPSTLAGLLQAAAGVLPIPEILHTIIRAGLQTDENAGEEAWPLFRALSNAALFSFLSAQSREQTESASEPLRKAKRFVHEHYAEPIDLERLSRHAGVTPNHLIRLFRHEGETSPMNYVWQVRLAYAVTWLKETGLQVAEVAYRAGFQSPFHFSRRFKERYGKAPREFRRAIVRRKLRPRRKNPDPFRR